MDGWSTLSFANDGLSKKMRMEEDMEGQNTPPILAEGSQMLKRVKYGTRVTKWGTGKNFCYETDLNN
jgi:hypothetical protein